MKAQAKADRTFPGIHRVRRAFAVVAAAVGFGILEAWQGRLYYADLPGGKFWPEALARTLPSWLILAALTPSIVLASRRLRIDRPGRIAALSGHLLFTAAFVVLHLGGTAVVNSLRHGGSPTVGAAFRSILYRYAVVDCFVYWAVAGIVWAVLHQTEWRARELAESELRAGLLEAKLAALRARLNPHFLFNTLASMATLAMLNERDSLVRALNSLSELLRRLLKESAEPVTSLDTELELIELYLDLQRLRFGARLVVEQRIQEEARRAAVPSLILQPLVENAVVHGVSGRSGPVTVEISALRREDRLILEVRDSGPGFPPEERAGDRPGIGLSSTRDRCEQFYGDAYRFECRGAPDGGAIASLDIPWRSFPALPSLELKAEEI